MNNVVYSDSFFPSCTGILNSKPEENFLEILAFLVQKIAEVVPWAKDHPGNIKVLSQYQMRCF